MTIYAAGVVCWREDQGKLLTALVHREKYQDWGFPKGKLDPGELLPETAVREVREEAGLKVRLGRNLGIIRYQVSSGEDKEVHYWASKITQKALNKQVFTPNQEIAKVEWIEAKEAVNLLSYDHDKELMKKVIALYKKRELETRALIVLRHCQATLRADWSGEEAKRPLLPEGKSQAKRLVPLLLAFGPRRIVTSPWTRCRDTLAPYSAKLKKPLIERRQLTELSNLRKPARTADVVKDLLGGARSAVMCSHRPALPSLLLPFVAISNSGLKEQIGAATDLAPGEFIVLRISMHGKFRVLDAERWGVHGS